MLTDTTAGRWPPRFGLQRVRARPALLRLVQATVEPPPLLPTLPSHEQL
jgi:hypothetical protein